MKKTVRTYTKRTLSVFMAALMLLTAWVFVAPQKAAAATAGKYKYRMVAWHDEYNRGMSHNATTVTVYVKKNNGTGGDANTSFSLSKNALDPDKDVKVYFPSSNGGEADGFPYKLGLSHIRTNNSTWDAHLYVDLQVYNYDTETWDTVAYSHYMTVKHALLDRNKGYMTDVGTSATTPYVNSVRWDNTAQTVTVSPTANKTATTLSATVKDQFGVEWYQEPSGYAISTSSTATTSSDANIGTNWGVSIAAASDYDTATVTFKKDTNDTSADGTLSKLIANNVYQKDFYVTAYRGTVKSSTTKITAKAQSYTYTYNGNGGTVSPTSYTVHQNYLISGIMGIDNKQEYQVYPSRKNNTNSGYRAGYNFRGMYALSSATQANLDSLVDNEAAGSSWTPSGKTELTSSTKVTGAKTWYAAWQAKDATLKFYDRDGNLSKTVIGKYNGGPATGESYPANPLSYTGAGSFNYTQDGWVLKSEKKYLANGTQQVDTTNVGKKYAFDLSDYTIVGDAEFDPHFSLQRNSDYKAFVYDGTQVASKTDYNYRDSFFGLVNGATRHPIAVDDTYHYEFMGWTARKPGDDNVTRYIRYTNPATGQITYKKQTTSNDALPATLTEDNNNHLLYPTVDGPMFTLYDDTYLVAVYDAVLHDYTVTMHYVASETGEDYLPVNTQVDAQDDPATEAFNEALVLHAGDDVSAALAAKDYPAFAEQYLGASEDEADTWNEAGQRYTLDRWAYSGGTIAEPNDIWTLLNKNALSIDLTAVYTKQEAQLNVSYLGAEGGDAVHTDTYSYGDEVTDWATTDDPNFEAIRTKDATGEAAGTGKMVFDKWNPEFQDTAKNDMTYFPEYVFAPYRRVRFYDLQNHLLYENDRMVVGDSIVYGGDTPTSEMTKADDKYGKNYSFDHWVDSEDHAVTRMPDADLDLYPHFEPEIVNDYVVQFKFYHGADEVTVPQTLHYGDKVTVPDEADCARASDERYHYTFSGWDKTPPKKVDSRIEFEDVDGVPTATYTAQYRTSHVTYVVTWLNNHGETVDGSDYFKKDVFVYEERIRTPLSEPVNNDTIEAQKEWVVDYWKLVKQEEGAWVDVLDDENNLIKCSKDDIVRVTETAENYYIFMPVYKQVNKTWTITIMDEAGENQTDTLKRESGVNINAQLGTPKAKAVTAAEHTVSGGWEVRSGSAPDYTWTLISAEATLTGNITVRPKYVTEPHTFKVARDSGNAIYTQHPTFTANGAATFVCTADDCGYEKADVSLGKLVDGVNPTAELYVKGTFYAESPNLEEQEEPIPISPDNLFVLTTDDEADPTTRYFSKANPENSVDELPAGGDEEAYEELTFNTERLGSGVQQIYAYVDKTATGVVPEGAEWQLAYAADPDAEEATATASMKTIADLFTISSGDTFVLFLKAVDGGENEAVIHSPKLQYDAVAPVVALDGEHTNEAKDTFCLVPEEPAPAEGEGDVQEDQPAVTITVTDATSVTLNGEPIELTEGAYKVTDPGTYTLRAEDAAQNTTIVNFTVNAAHTNVNYHKDPTCTIAGYDYDLCKVCGTRKDNWTEEQMAPLGHDYESEGAKVRVVEPTCAAGGYTIKTCARCGEITRTGETPASGDHSWNSGVLKRSPNCSTFGVIEYTCTVCKTKELVSGEDFEAVANEEATEEQAARVARHSDAGPLVAKQTDNHSYTKPGIVTQEPGCTDDGVLTYYCDNNAAHKRTEPIPAVGHNFGAWTVTTAATCSAQGEETRTCSRCSEPETRTIDINPEGHKWIEDTEVEDPVPGVTYYKCEYCGTTKQEGTPTVRYTFTFLNENETVFKTLSKLVGETITASDIGTPTKESVPQYDYTFKAWADEDDNEITLPFNVTANMGDQTYHVVFNAATRHYTLTFLNDDCTPYSQVGPRPYGDTVTPVGPPKNSDTNYTYTFEGWVLVNKVDGEWVDAEGATPVTSITVTGPQTYRAEYSKTERTYQVRWIVVTTIVKTLKGVTPGTLLSTLAAPDDPESVITDTQHSLFQGWDVPDSTPVNADIDVRAKFISRDHDYQLSESKTATCTTPAQDIYKCSVCEHEKAMTKGSALGHNYELLNRVNPTATTNGSKTEKCSRCGDIRTVDLTPIFLKVTVRDQNGNPVSGVKVYVYDDDVDSANPVGTGTTNNSGEATIVVPEAKTYRVVVEGNTGSVTVDQNGNITGGGVPTVTRGGGGNPTPSSHGCDCTCHKSGFWPMIFRFFHKIIKMITGEFRCCTDANY